MLAIRNDLVKHDSANTLSQLPTPTQSFPSSWCIWPALDNPAIRAAVWTQDAHRIYSDPAHTPARAHKRIVTPGEARPPILTTYGVAPYLPAGTLGSAAIYGYGIYALLLNSWRPRHFTAAELAAAHGLPDWNSPLVLQHSKHAGCAYSSLRRRHRPRSSSMVHHPPSTYKLRTGDHNVTPHR